MTDYMLLLAPELLLIVGAVLTMIAGLAGRAGWRVCAPWLAFAATAAALVTQWSAPAPAAADLPGIRITSLTAYVRLITLSIGLLVLLVNMHLPESHERGEFFGLVLFSAAGVTLTATADDLIGLFLALELVSVPTYVLVAAGSREARAQEAGMKYFFLGALAAAVLVYGLSFIYGAAGTTRLSAMAGRLEMTDPYALVGLLLAVAGASYKLAAVPFHVYAADVYEGAASPVAGVLGFFPKLAGFVALIRLMGLVTPMYAGPDETAWIPPDVLFWVLWALAAATMTVGNCLALLQTNVKRVLAYSSIAHSGYMLVAVLVGPALTGGLMRNGWSAMLFYVAAYGVMNLGAFGLLALIRAQDRPAEDIRDLAGLARQHPVVALAIAICLFSLMGMPPTVGFLGKVFIFVGALSLGDDDPHRHAMIVLAVVGVLNAAVGAAYYLRIIGAVYLREPREVPQLTADRPLQVGVALCCGLLLLAGIWPRHLASLANDAAGDLRPAPGISRSEASRSR